MPLIVEAAGSLQKKSERCLLPIGAGVFRVDWTSPKLLTTGCFAGVLNGLAGVLDHALGCFHMTLAGANHSGGGAFAGGLHRANSGLMEIPFSDAGAGVSHGAADGMGDSGAGGHCGSAHTLRGMADGGGGAGGGGLRRIAGHKGEESEGGYYCCFHGVIVAMFSESGRAWCKGATRNRDDGSLGRDNDSWIC